MPARRPSLRTALPVSLFLAVSMAGLLSAPAGASGVREAFLLESMYETDSPTQRLEICREILQENPANYARFFCEGYESIALGLHAEAQVLLERALDERPDFAVAAILYGQAYERLGLREEAERYFRRAIEVQPQRVDARFLLGSLLFRRGTEEDPAHLKEALEAFRQMTEADPTSPDGWSNMALVLTHMDRFDDAEAIYKKAIQRAPDDPFGHTSLGALYARQDRNEDAEASWKEALRLNPGYGQAIVELAALYARTDRLTEALEVLESGRRAVTSPPWGPRVRRNLGFAYLRLGAPDLAEARLREATRQGEDALAFLGLAHAWMLQGDTKSALGAYERGVAIDSVLAIPFVLAWKATLKYALEGDAYPAVAGEIAWIDSGDASVSEAMPALTATGADATNQLVEYVLEGWSFDDAEIVLEEIRAALADSLQGSFDVPPTPIVQVPPEYPVSAQEAGLEGTVQVRVMVDEKGRVENAEVETCNAPISLCEAARKAARDWVFSPATRYGAPVRASVVIPFRFTTQK